jgi:hypothetical protein
MALVRPTLVTMEEVDDALVDRLDDFTVTLLGVGATAVPVILEENVPVEDKVYPRITIECLGEVEAFENHHAEDGDGYLTDIDDGPTPNLNTMRATPESVKLRYQISAWVKNDTAAIRSLMQKFRAEVGRRDRLVIAQPAPEDVARSLWLMQEGDTILLKERPGDELILQAVWTYGIFCELDRGGESIEKAVHQLEFGLWQGVDKDAKYRSFQFDADSFTPLA